MCDKKHSKLTSCICINSERFFLVRLTCFHQPWYYTYSIFHGKMYCTVIGDEWRRELFGHSFVFALLCTIYTACVFLLAAVLSISSTEAELFPDWITLNLSLVSCIFHPFWTMTWGGEFSPTPKLFHDFRKTFSLSDLDYQNRCWVLWVEYIEKPAVFHLCRMDSHTNQTRPSLPFIFRFSVPSSNTTGNHMSLPQRLRTRPDHCPLPNPILILWRMATDFNF